MERDGIVPFGVKFMKTQDGYYVDVFNGTKTPAKQCNRKLKVMIVVAALVSVLIGVCVVSGLAIGGFFKESTTGKLLGDTAAVDANNTLTAEPQFEESTTGKPLGYTTAVDGENTLSAEPKYEELTTGKPLDETTAVNANTNNTMTSEYKYKVQNASIVTTDGRCGPAFNNLECPINSTIPGWGPTVHHCCSRGGWCGNTEAHCSGINYRRLYAPTAQHPSKVTIDGRCGPLFNNLECPINSSIPGWGPTIHHCCSDGGWCGNTGDHCSGINYRELYAPTDMMT
ncbi:unnamed protein product [Owenia fusiformis]|uniref:Uncharacterized protein n=1 Tax=Owenia fusiformis TaxID=6347 RepID=A0A8J1Y0B2_OWEFU|nr:unnamed protein product [Owenia fusiformis]